MKPILPTPKSYEILEGKLSLAPAVLAKDERFAPLANAFAQAFEKITDQALARAEAIASICSTFYNLA